MILLTTKTQLQLRDRVLELMKNNDSFLDMCLLMLYEQQTFDERQIKNSVHRNSVGFNRPDAYLLSDYSIWKINFSDRSIKRELKTTLINKLEKYALQLSSYREVVAALDGSKDPTSIVTRVKNEIDVIKLDPFTSLEDYLNYKKLEREKEQKEIVKKQREEERGPTRGSGLTGNRAAEQKRLNREAVARAWEDIDRLKKRLGAGATAPRGREAAPGAAGNLQGDVV